MSHAHFTAASQVLHLVDFDQLKIENQQYMERIEERNNELLKLKLSTSRTVQVGKGRGKVKNREGGGAETGGVENIVLRGICRGKGG